MEPARKRRDLPVGSLVEVHSDFLDRWVAGFAVVRSSAAGYRLRRLSDRSILPRPFATNRVRLATY
jgi:hypothetical protein